MSANPAERRLQQRALVGVSIGHAAHDSWYGLAPVLLASLSPQLGLSNSEIALALLLYQAFSSISQPFFGRLSERVSSRVLGVSAIVWTTLMFSAVTFAGSKWLLALFIGLAGFGSGAWHPQGTANATLAGGQRWAATATSIFFLGGTLGSAVLGAGLGGVLLDAFGRPALLLVSAITLLLAFTLVRSLVPATPVHRPQQGSTEATAHSQAAAQTAGTQRTFLALVAVLFLATALRSLAFTSLNTFIPKYEQDLGATSSAYGLLMLAFLATTAFGGLIGAYLADHVGLRAVLTVTLFLTAICFWLFLRASGIGSFVLFAITGLVVGPSHTLLVVAGQRRFPGRIAMISGVFLGFTFVSGAGGAWLLGLLGDHIGLPNALGLLPWVCVGAGLCALIAAPGRRTEHTSA